MINIGLDFGTTYSVISQLKDVRVDGSTVGYQLEAFIPGQSSTPNQASLVLRREDQNNFLEFASDARTDIGDDGTIAYRGFKMMLSEKDESRLKLEGYVDGFTPQRIVKAYIDNILKTYVHENGFESEKIDKVVIGVPEIWFDDITTIDCRTTLANLVSELLYVDSVELVSEPAAACAFFVDNYRKVNGGKRYNGHVLIIDYGGGTLDIALCNVQDHGDSSEVSVIKRCGAGLNEEGTIGQAGLAFIETIVKMAFDGKIPDEELRNNEYFLRAVNHVEDKLIARKDAIRDAFQMYDEVGPLNEMTDVFCPIKYAEKGTTNVTYGMLAMAFEAAIQQVLSSKLDEIIEYMDAKGIRYGNEAGDEFKIAPVGGFCNFYLTRKLIRDRFGTYEGDNRYKGIIIEPRDAEKAISYGATLIANNIISFRQLSPYHFGIYLSYRDTYLWAIHMGDEIESGKIFYLTLGGDEPLVLKGDRIGELAYCHSEDATVCPHSGAPIESFSEKLHFSKKNYHKIGFSFDQSMIITAHIFDLDENDNVIDEQKITLDELTKIFGGLIIK